LATSYDEVPYARYAYPRTHPDRLATIASLFGMKPAPIDHCRVLEFGCGSGDNLIGMALTLPESRFAGIDLSGRQIDAGLQTAADLGISNVELRRCSIEDVDRSFGQFDYIIAHGVFSWVPARVQDKLLAICAQLLAPEGVAYISYNTYPGWHFHALIRGMMRYHAERYREPSERILQARALVYFLSQSVQDAHDPYSMLLDHEVASLDCHTDSYLFHEYLEEVNDPVYFHQFVKQAAAHRLQYLGEADASNMSTHGLSLQVEQIMARLAEDWVQRQQYLDFVRNRQFRESLLCHDDVVLDWDRRFDNLGRYFLASVAMPTAPPVDIHSLSSVEFRGRGPGGLTTAYPIVKAALQYLAETWPQALPFEQVQTIAQARMQSGEDSDLQRSLDRSLLAGALLDGFLGSNLVEWHVHAAPVTGIISEQPVASRLARYQAVGQKTVTNLRHETVVLTDFERFLVRKLDGTRDREALTAELQRHLGEEGLGLPVEVLAAQAPEMIRRVVGQHLENALRKLASHGLLVPHVER
jgi:methyltransferase-like protein/SAM-dependent methyltransferase